MDITRMMKNIYFCMRNMTDMSQICHTAFLFFIPLSITHAIFVVFVLLQNYTALQLAPRTPYCNLSFTSITKTDFDKV